MFKSGSKKMLVLAEALMEQGYTLGPKIGSGSFAKVCLVERIADGKMLAAKIIDTDKAGKDFVEVFMPQELDIVSNMTHENIVNVYDVVQTEKLVCIVMDYAQKGDLLDMVLSNGTPSEEEAKKIFKQIVSAIHHMHQSGMVHRDLKCENILISSDDEALVSDFSFSRRVNQDLCETYCGSAAYSSPQIIEATPYNAQKSDVWSMGCILYILACGAMPFDDSNVMQMVKHQKEGVQVESQVSSEMKELIEGMLECDETKRYSTSQVLASAWLN